MLAFQSGEVILSTFSASQHLLGHSLQGSSSKRTDEASRIEWKDKKRHRTWKLKCA